MAAEYQLSAEITPDLASDFTQLVQTKISSALSGVTASVRVTGELAPGFARDLQAKIKAELARISLSVEVKADTRKAKLDIDVLVNDKRDKTINLRLDTKQFDADIRNASRRLDQLALKGLLVSGGVGGGGGGGGNGLTPIVGGGGGGGGGSGQNAGILTGVLPGGRRAGPGAILGGIALATGPAAGTALAAIPLALATIGTIAEHSDAQVTSAFANMETAAKQALVQGFKPLVPELTAIAGQGQAAITSLTPEFQQAAAAVSPLVRVLSTDLVNATKQGVTDLTSEIGRTAPVVEALHSGFSQLEHGVAGLFANLNVNSAAEGLHQVINLVQTLLPEVGSLISGIAPLANSALEVANALLAGLAPALRGVANLMNIPGIAPLVLGFGALALVSKTLTGSWTSLLSLVGGGKWNELATSLNLNTRAASSNKSAVAANADELAGYRLQIASANAELAKNNVVTAENAVATDASLVNTRALAMAKLSVISTDEALIAAEAGVTAAEVAAATAAKGFWASVGPVGWAILGITAVATAIGFVGGSSTAASTAAATLTTQIEQLNQAGGSSAATFAQNNAQYKDLVQNANAAKIPLQDVFSAIDKGSTGLADLAGNTQTALDKWGAAQPGASNDRSRARGQEQISTVSQLTDAVNRHDKAYSSLTSTQKSQVDRENALRDALKSQTQATQDAKDAEALRAAAVSVSTHLTQGSAQALADSNRQLLQSGDYTNTVTKAQKSFNDILDSGLGGSAAFISNLQTLNAATYTTQARTAEAAYSVGTLNVVQQAGAIVADKVTNANGQLATSIADVARNTEQVGIDTSAANAEYAALQSGMSQTAAIAEGLAAAQDKVNSDFAAATAPIENQIKNTIAYNAALQGATTTQNTIASQARAVADAQDALNQARAPGTGLVAQALYNQAQAHLGLTSAIHGEQQADIAAGNAQKNLTLARKDAIQTLKDLSLQTKDQADTEAEAKLKLIDAQNAVNALGLQNSQLKIKDINLTGSVNYANETQYKALLVLDEAKNAYNDTLNNSAKLATTDAQATALGVNNAPSVVAAQQAVNDALYNQGQQTLAVAAANHNIMMQGPSLHNAYKQLNADSLAVKTAQDSQTSATDLTTTAVVNLFDAWVKNHDNSPIVESDFVTVAQKAFGVHAGVKAIADRLFGTGGETPGVNGASAGFSIVGTPSLNLSALITQAQAMGIDPRGLGFSGQQILTAKTPGSFGNVPGPIGSSYAAGGPIHGIGGPTADNIVIRASVGEHMWTADEVQKAGGHGAVSAMRAAVRGYATGGPIGPGEGTSVAAARYLLGTNIKLATMQAFGQNIANSLAKFGITPKSHLAFSAAGAAPIPIDFGAFAVRGGDGASASTGGRTLGGAIPVGQHRAIIDAALAADAIPAGQWPQWEIGLNTLIGRESGWNPNAINLWDSNAKAGHPSQGLGQTIPGTFEANRNRSLPDNILDPVANVAAVIRYILGRYHGIGNVQQANAALPPKGYDNGGILGPGDVGVNRLRQPEAVLTPAEKAAYQAHAQAAAANKPIRLDDYTIARLAQALSLANNDRPVNIKLASQGSGVFIP